MQKSTDAVRTEKLPPAAPPETNGNGTHANGTDTNSAELYDLLHALQQMLVGDFSVRLPGHQVGLMGKIADTFNSIVASNQRMAQQLERVGQVVGREGKTRQRIRLAASAGAWGEMENSVNTMID
ncbi:MAG: hypothetical protein FJX66_16240 [Alphaproteobacteria bacterium]|nr:hypothetical protein [Alphaproteobacteria bacterium]